MSILGPEEQCSIQQRQNITANRIRQNSKQLLHNIKHRYETLFNSVWNNSLGLTPQEVLDSIGGDAYELFVYSDMVKQWISRVDPDYNPPQSPKEFRINQDGTVTVLD